MNTRKKQNKTNQKSCQTTALPTESSQVLGGRCMCLVYAYICRSVHMPVNAWKARESCNVSCSISLSTLFYWECLSLNLDLRWQPASPNDSPSASHSPGVIGSQRHTQLFTWVLGIWTQTLMLGKQAVLLSELFPQDPKSMLSMCASTKLHYQATPLSPNDFCSDIEGEMFN